MTKLTSREEFLLGVGFILKSSECVEKHLSLNAENTTRAPLGKVIRARDTHFYKVFTPVKASVTFSK